MFFFIIFGLLLKKRYFCILLIQILLAMKKLVVLTGAGMSAESGMTTFRDAGGLWEQYPVEQVASHEGWLKDPVLVNNFYNMLRKKLVNAKPNRGHELVASLEKDFNVVVVTQNVDNLHERAGSSKVIHLHGELMKTCSSNDAYDPRYIKTLDENNLEVKPGEKADDGSLRRPFIVFFGESVPQIEPAIEETMTADIFVVIGTSLNVYPAAGLLRYVPNGKPIFLIDPKPVSSHAAGNVEQLMMGASEGMEELVKRLDKLK